MSNSSSKVKKAGGLRKGNFFYDLVMRSDGFVSVLVVLMGFLVATILVLCVGKNPLNMYKAIIQSCTGLYVNKKGDLVWNVRYIGEFLNYSIPYILCGFAMAFAGRVGLFNVGGEGQYIMGVTVAQLVAFYFWQIPGIHWMVALIAAILAGAIWGGVVGYLKAKFEVSEVVTTIMLNYVALYLSRIITRVIPGTSTWQTPPFPKTALLGAEWMKKLTNGSMLNYGIFITVIAILVFWFLMEKTKLGYSLKATGYNRDAAHYAGIPVVSSIVIAMAVSGAFAGLGGGIVALGYFKYGRVLSGMDNYGFTGIAVALVGNNKAVGTTLAGLLFGMLQASQTMMQSKGIPKEITFIIQGLVVVFVALKEGLRIIFMQVEKRRAQKEAALSGDAEASSDAKASSEAAVIPAEKDGGAE